MKTTKRACVARDDVDRELRRRPVHRQLLREDADVRPGHPYHQRVLSWPPWPACEVLIEAVQPPLALVVRVVRLHHGLRAPPLPRRLHGRPEEVLRRQREAQLFEARLERQGQGGGVLRLAASGESNASGHGCKRPDATTIETIYI